MADKGRRKKDSASPAPAVHQNKAKGKKLSEQAAPPAVPDTSDSSQAGSDDGNESDASDVQVEFEHYDPTEADYHLIKLLLRRYLSIDFDVQGLTELIISQSTVGTVLKTAGEPEVYGLISVLNLHRYRDHKCIEQISSHLLAQCPAHQKGSFSKVLKARDTGLIVSERIFNLPPTLAYPLHQALFDEVQWAIEDEPTAERRASFSFKNYLILTHYVRERPRAVPNKKKKLKTSAPVASASAHAADEPNIYVKLEDEVWETLSTTSFTFPLPKSANDENEILEEDEVTYDKFAQVFVCSSSAAPTLVAKLKELTGL